jgi:hypothetical protein
MSAVELRKAAAKMRKRVDPVIAECGVRDASEVPWFDATDYYADITTAVHAYVASWPPVVALAVADWLDDTALSGITEPRLNAEAFRNYRRALAVARVYLDGAP